ncbi:hypothetical protein evm_006663 [Chilo suppressalis]|nr:hypothetical protein evm_006663 [Chilo suppressalis]
MFVKFVAFLCIVGCACAGDLTSFAYGVADPFTGDFKSQTETRLGEDVRGQYSLLDTDGFRRTVDYSAGAEGFNAVVRRDPALAAYVAPAPAPVISYAAPIGYNIKLANIGVAPYAYARYIK